MNLNEWFGDIDIYVFDQLLKGRLRPGMRLLDAGCGHGRNLVWFLRNGYDVHGVDVSPEAVAAARELASRLAPQLPAERFRVAPIEALGLPGASFDAVLANAVLHFAADEAHFERMLLELWRVLAPGGLLFARLASEIAGAQPLGGRRFHLPDGTDRFLVNDAILLAWTERLQATLLDPIKTTNVQGLRCMTTWCIRKGAR